MIREGLVFDDVLLVPKFSSIETRSSVDLSVSIDKLGVKFSSPIIPANMKDIIGYDMARAIYMNGGFGILHRFIPLEDQIQILIRLEEEFGLDVWKYIGFSVGVKKEDYTVIDELIFAGARSICIDIAHGDSKLCVDMCSHISQTYPTVLLIAGNVATYSGTLRLFNAGADMVKLGVGPGFLCSTRIETGNGVPQLTALMDARKALDNLSLPYKQRLIIADGGIKSAGDVVKSLCFADMVMIGNMFAGCEESPGETVVVDDNVYKKYAGSSTLKTTHIEGVEALVPIKGNFKSILTKITDGLSSGCSYQGVSSLKELREEPEFIKMTNSGLIESHPRNIKSLK